MQDARGNLQSLEIVFIESS